MSLPLINAAIDAGHEKETDDAAVDAAKKAEQEAEAIDAVALQKLTDAAQALHDDLVANGREVVVDTSTSPLTVTIYEAVDPGSYSATPVRVAG